MTYRFWSWVLFKHLGHGSASFTLQLLAVCTCHIFLILLIIDATKPTIITLIELITFPIQAFFSKPSHETLLSVLAMILSNNVCKKTGPFVWNSHKEREATVEWVVACSCIVHVSQEQEKDWQPYAQTNNYTIKQFHLILKQKGTKIAIFFVMHNVSFSGSVNKWVSGLHLRLININVAQLDVLLPVWIIAVKLDFICWAD